MDKIAFQKLWDGSGLNDYYKRMDFLESLGFTFSGQYKEMEPHQAEHLEAWLEAQSTPEKKIGVLDVSEDELRVFAKECFSVDAREVKKKLQEALDTCRNLSKIRLDCSKDYAYAAVVKHRHSEPELSERATQNALWHDGSRDGLDTGIWHLHKILTSLP